MEKCVRPSNEDDAEVKCEEFYMGIWDEEVEDDNGRHEPMGRDRFLLDVWSALGSGMPGGFIEALSAYVDREPAVMECTWRSVVSSLLEIALLGLVPDGVQAALVVRGRHCVGLALYEGAKLYLEQRAGMDGVYADVVRANDSFEYRPGVIRRHGYRQTEERGGAYAAYARVVTRDGVVRSAILAKHEIELSLEHFSPCDGRLWKDHWEDMAKLLALRSLMEELGMERKSMLWCSRLK